VTNKSKLKKYIYKSQKTSLNLKVSTTQTTTPVLEKGSIKEVLPLFGINIYVWYFKKNSI